MQAAPPVRVELDRSAAWAVLVAMAISGASAAFAGWLALRVDASPALGLGVFAGVGAASVFRNWRRQVPAVLAWDGRAWSCNGREGDIVVSLDAGAWMLMCFRPAGGPDRWLAAGRQSTNGSWHDLRAALFARQVPEPLAGPAA